MFTAPAASFVLAAALTPGDLQANAAAGDPTDDKGIACAMESQAGYGIAGGIYPLKLERYARPVILPPRRLLEMFEEVRQSSLRSPLHTGQRIEATGSQHSVSLLGLANPSAGALVKHDSMCYT